MADYSNSTISSLLGSNGGLPTALKVADTLTLNLAKLTLNGDQAGANYSDALAIQVGGNVILSVDNSGGAPAVTFGNATSNPTFAFTTSGAISFPRLALATGATVTGINDTDTMTDASATTLATSESIKAYVDSQSASGFTLTDGTTGLTISGGDTLTFTDSDGINAVTSAVDTVTFSLSATNTTITGLSNLVTVGALTSGSLASGFGNISIGASTITNTGTADLGATTVDSLNASSGGITNAGAISGATTIGSSGAATLDSGAAGSSFGGALTVSGDLTVSSHALFADDKKAKFGSGDDVHLYWGETGVPALRFESQSGVKLLSLSNMLVTSAGSAGSPVSLTTGQYAYQGAVQSGDADGDMYTFLSQTDNSSGTALTTGSMSGLSVALTGHASDGASASYYGVKLGDPNKSGGSAEYVGVEVIGSSWTRGFRLGDGVDGAFGSDDDLLIAHSGSAGTLTNGTGTFTLTSNGGILLAAGSNEIDLTTTGALDLNSGVFTLNASTVTVTSSGDQSYVLTDGQTWQVGDAGNGSMISLDTSGGSEEFAIGVAVNFAGNVTAEDDVTIALGGDDDFTMVHDGTDTIFDNTFATGASIFRLGTDTAATKFAVQNNSASELFSVDASGETTVTGNLTVSGNAFVQGTTLQVDATVQLMADSVIVVSSGPSALQDGGLAIERYYTAWGTATESGTAQAGAAQAITLAAGANEGDDYYNNFSIAITGGTGAGQQRTISDYNGTSKVADVDRVWDTQPDATSTYAVHQTADRFAVMIWDESADEFVFGRTHLDPSSGNVTVEDNMAIHMGGCQVDDLLNVDGTADFDVTQFDVDVSGAGFSLDADTASNVTVTGGNLTLSTASSGTLAVNSAGLLDIDAAANLDIDVTGTFDVLASGAFSIDGTGASNLSATSGNLTVSTITSGTLALTSAGALDLDGTVVTIDGSASLTLTSTGGTMALNAAGQTFDLDGATFDADFTSSANLTAVGITLEAGSGAFTVQGDSASTINATGANLTLSTTTSGTLAVSSAANLDLDGVAVTIDGSGGVSIDGSGAASNFSSTSQNLTISTITSGTLSISSAGDLDLTSTGSTVTITSTADTFTLNAAGQTIDMDGADVQIDGTSGVSIDGSGAASNFSSTSQNLTISTITSGSLILTGAALVDINAGANLDIDVTGTFDMLSSGAFSIDGTGASNVSATSGNLTLSTITSGDLLMSSAAGATLTVASDLTLAVTGEVISVTSLNTDGTGVSNGDMVSLDGSGTLAKASAATHNHVAGVATEAAGAATQCDMAGLPGTVVTVSTDLSVAGIAKGAVVYLSETAGAVVASVASFSAGSHVIRVGVVVDDVTDKVLFQPQYMYQV